jgi:hypothetical protein
VAGDGLGDGSGKAPGEVLEKQSPAGEEQMARPVEFALTVETAAAEQQAPALPYPVVEFRASAGGCRLSNRFWKISIRRRG